MKSGNHDRYGGGNVPEKSLRRARLTSRKREKERGAAMVEFALVLPIFLALVIGIISFGYMLSYRQAVSQAASEGARAAAVAPANFDGNRTTKALDAMNEQLGYYGVSCSGTALMYNGTGVGTCSVSSAEPCTNDASRQCVTVIVTHDYRDHPLVPSFPGLGVTLPDHLTYKAVVEVTT